jgi:HEAT repeat protein
VADTEELLRLLGLDSEPLALYAALHLEGATGPEVEAALRVRLTTAGPELAEAVCDRLGEILPQGELSRNLLEILESGSEPAQIRALRLWGRTLGERVDALLLPYLKRRSGVLHVLATLVGTLEWGEGPLVGDTLQAVTELLAHPDPRVRANAAELVAARGGKGLQVPLSGMLEDSVPRVRAAAARAVWAWDPGMVQSHLERDLASLDRRVLLAALHVVGVLPDYPEALDILVNAGEHPEPQIRLMALRSMAGREDYLKVSWLAERFLAEDSQACCQAISERIQGDRREFFCDRLLEELRLGKEPRRRSRAARGLGEVRFQKHEVALVSWVLDPDDRVRADVIESLGHMGGEGIEPVLWHAVQDPAPRVAANAALALWRRGGEQALTLLVEWLRGDDLARAASAAFALGEIGSERVVGPLLELGERLQHEGDSSFACRGLLKQIMKALTKVRGT